MSNSFNLFCRAGFLLLFAFQSICLTVPAQKTVTGSAKNGHLILFDAIRSGSSEELKNALADGANENDSLMGYSALMMAALEGTADQMTILINHGARVNDTTRNGITALWLALPDMEKITLLLDHGADIHHTISGYGILVKLATMPRTGKGFSISDFQGRRSDGQRSGQSVIIQCCVNGRYNPSGVSPSFRTKS
ncbi:MAG: ankyrin repeat domain-containing protein [Puia sp.]